MATQYRFKTVMVSDSDRSDFSTLRDSFGIKVSDKELFSAIFNIVDKDKVKELILETKKTEAISKEKEKIKKLEVKLKEKLQKLQSNQTEEKKEKVS
jgi:hypothetical protein